MLLQNLESNEAVCSERGEPALFTTALESEPTEMPVSRSERNANFVPYSTNFYLGSHCD